MGLIERGEILCVPALEVGSREKLEFLAYFDDPARLEDFYSREVEPYKRARFFTKLDRSFTHLIPAAKEAGAATINYGVFVNACIKFLIVAFAVFILVKQVNRLYKKPPPPPPTVSAEAKLLEEIRDLLRTRA
ncbi:MAG: MscL family protein [Deltaproteobacteria bacterium]|nr:MscL family protein [Deltaproteobacteria bacterium]